jgi:hypothetical protein
MHEFLTRDSTTAIESPVNSDIEVDDKKVNGVENIIIDCFCTVIHSGSYSTVGQ